MKPSVYVSKRNLENVETWRYSGEIQSVDAEKVIIHAYFNNKDMDVYGLELRTGDLFVEYFYFSRWFNIFRVYDHTGSIFKGCYCNIASPAKMKDGLIFYTDLALDLIIFPRKDYLVLDIHEFEDLNLTPKYQGQALRAVEDLILGINKKGRYADLPFSVE